MTSQDVPHGFCATAAVQFALPVIACEVSLPSMFLFRVGIRR